MLNAAVLNIAPDDHMGPVISLVLMALLYAGLLFILVVAIRKAREWRREGGAADRAIDPNAVLREGEGFVHGVVEFDEGMDYAVVVEVRQVGKEQRKRKGGHHHSWSEVERRTLTHPFWIKIANGERVRVEPGAEVKLVDQLDILVHDQLPRERFRIAELSAGETVVAKGLLTSKSSGASAENYRDVAPRTWVLQQALGGELHLTAEKLGDQHRRVSKTFVKRIAFGWLPSVLLVTALCGPFIGRLTLGQPTSIVVAAKYHTPRHGKTAAVWGVSFRDARGEDCSERLDSDDWFEVTDGDTLAYIDVPAHPWISGLGARPTFHVFGGIAALVIVLICMSGVLVPPSKPWYDAGRVHSSGPGRLPGLKPSTRRVYSRDA